MNPGIDLFSLIGSMEDEDSREAVRLLESGESPGQVASRLGEGPAELVAALALASLGRDGSGGLPLSRGEPTHPGLKSALAESAWSPLLNDDALDRLALSAGLLQLFDFWDASHDAMQEAEDLGEHRTAAYWHMIAHRREPHPANARYWANHVDPHPVSTAIIDHARPLLEAHGDAALNSLLLDEGWNHVAMIALCAHAKPGSADNTLARRIQRVEMIALLEASLSACLSGG